MSRNPPLRDRVQTALRIDRAVRLVWDTAPRWTLANLVLVLVQGVLPLAALYLMKRIVDAVSAGLVAPDRTADFQPVLVWIGRPLSWAPWPATAVKHSSKTGSNTAPTRTSPLSFV
jgi:ATP-binding cassette subfamily B protein